METQTPVAKKKCETLTKCCNTCPFLLENADKPNPAGWIPDKEKGFTDWYTQENLNNLWRNGLAHGEPMLCHTHDPDAKEYGGKGSTNEKGKLCMGSVMAIFPHAKRFETLLNEDPKHNPNKAYRTYKKEFGKQSMTLPGITEVCIWFALGRTSLMGGTPVPRSSDEDRPFREIK